MFLNVIFLFFRHNFQHYFGFFTTIQEAMAEDRFTDLKKHIEQQIPADPEQVIGEKQEES